MDNGLKHLVDVLAGLRRNRYRAGGIQTDHVFDLLPHPFRFRGGEIDLVQYRDDLEAGIERLINIRERLGLNALAGVDNEQRPLARCEAA